MRGLDLVRPGEHLKLLCIGAHPDDIEIGAAGTILTWISSGVHLAVTWCVASADGERKTEAESSMSEVLTGADEATFSCGGFRDGYLPYEGAAVKQWVAGLSDFDPDVILTHRLEDAHQDHRLLAELTSNLFRHHLILEYEIPKWDGDLGQPNLYMPLTEEVLGLKTSLLKKHFPSQVSRDWFDEETFRSLARLRGMECRAADRYAEAFWLRKAVITSRGG